MPATIRLRLAPSKEACEILSETIEQYTWAFNDVCYYGWHNNVSNGIKLHDATYNLEIPSRRYRLPSQLVCSARGKAAEVIKSTKALQKKGKLVSFPQSTSCPIRRMLVLTPHGGARMSCL